MSTWVLMRILESAPSRYDLGMRLLTLGRIDRAYDRLAEHIRPGQRVLDLGCGTGALTLRAARRGAQVTGIDTNPAMLEIARRRVGDERLWGRVELQERGVAELGSEEAGSYDVVTAGLLLSELGEDETSCALGEARRLLRPGGLLLVADEVRPRGTLARLCNGLIRVQLVAIAYLTTQQTSRPVRHFTERLRRAGFEVLSERRSGLGTFIEVVARRPPGASAEGER